MFPRPCPSRARDVAQASISGEVSWESKTFTGSGTHRLKWRYYKDSSVSAGDDGGRIADNGTRCKYGWDCAKGFTCANGTDWMQTTVTGAGTLKFWWKVSSECGGDYPSAGSGQAQEFYIDGQLQDALSGTGGVWTQKSYRLGTGTGDQKLRVSHTLQPIAPGLLCLHVSGGWTLTVRSPRRRSG